MSNKLAGINLKPEHIFFLITFSFGFCFSIITPPFQIPDEINHFLRAYQISEGKLIGAKKEGLSGGNLPRAVGAVTNVCAGIPFNYNKKINISRLKRFLDIKIDYSKQKFIHFPNTVLYNPIPYTGQIIGLLIGKILNFTPLFSFYLGRITNLLLSTILMYYAIKLTPYLKWTFLFLAIMPMSIFLLPSFSTDSFTISISFLYFAYILYLSYNNHDNISSINIILLYLLSILVAMSKQAYFGLIFLYFIIPPYKFKSLRSYFFHFSSIFIICSIFMIIWSSLVKNIYVPLRPLEGIYPDEQALFIFKNIPFFIATSIFDLFTNTHLVIQFVGKLGWLDAPIPLSFALFYLLILFFVTIVDNNKIAQRKAFDNCIKIIVIIITVEFIMAILYMTWNPVGSKTIEGLQGRYLIPLAPIFFSLFYRPNKSLEKINTSNYFQLLKIIMIILSVSTTTFVLLNRYYLI